MPTASTPNSRVLASDELPRPLPYNSFVVLPDGCLVTKDFAGSRPGAPVAADERRPCELVVLEPGAPRDHRPLELPEPSIARLSADGDEVYVVGDTSLLRVPWNGATLRPDAEFRARYRTLEGQTYGWDCVLATGAAWFLDDGDGSERYAGTLRGQGCRRRLCTWCGSTWDGRGRQTAEVCGLPGGLVANPPVIDERRRIAVGLRQRQRCAGRLLLRRGRRAHHEMVTAPGPREPPPAVR